MSNWKPISENPKENGRYLVTVQGEEDKYVTTAEFEFCEVKNKAFWDIQDTLCDCTSGKITAWDYLPEPF